MAAPIRSPGAVMRKILQWGTAQTYLAVAMALLGLRGGSFSRTILTRPQIPNSKRDTFLDETFQLEALGLKLVVAVAYIYVDCLYCLKLSPTCNISARITCVPCKPSSASKFGDSQANKPQRILVAGDNVPERHHFRAVAVVDRRSNRHSVSPGREISRNRRLVQNI